MIIDDAYLDDLIAECQPWRDGKPLTAYWPAADVLALAMECKRLKAERVRLTRSLAMADNFVEAWLSGGIKTEMQAAYEDYRKAEDDAVSAQAVSR